MTKEKREKEMLKIQLLLFGWENYLIRWLYKTSFLGTVWLARFATSTDRKSTRLNSSHESVSRMPSSA